MAVDAPDDDLGRSPEAGRDLSSGGADAVGGLSWLEQRDRKARQALERFARNWKTWQVRGGGYPSPGTTCVPIQSLSWRARRSKNWSQRSARHSSTAQSSPC